jgi:ProP effector
VAVGCIGLIVRSYDLPLSLDPFASMSTDTPAPPTKSPEAAAERLKALFPALFGGAPKPIKLRIQADIEARAPGQFSKAVLTAFLRRHTATNAYLKALVREPQRIDLDGQPAGEISDEHREAAKKALADRRERQQAREQEMETARRWRLDLLADWQRTSLSRENFCALKGIEQSSLDALLEQAKAELAAAPPAAPRRFDRPERRPDNRGPGQPGRPGDRPRRPPRP